MIVPPAPPKWVCPQCKKPVEQSGQDRFILVMNYAEGQGYGMFYCRDCGLLFTAVSLPLLDAQLKSLPKTKKKMKR